MSVGIGDEQAGGRMKKSRTVPDFELILGGPQESFRWNVHGYPFDLAKWHYHPEYELHLIQQSSGKMFIGDYVGNFSPGTLVLTGPNLPHNWVSDIAPGEYVRNRDMLVQFKDSFVREAMQMWPEFKEIEPLLNDARYGIEFHGDAAIVGANVLLQIGQATAMRRLLLLFELLYELAVSPERRVLSSRDYGDAPDSAAADTIKQVLGFLMKNIAKDVHLSDAARCFGMSEPAFSRFFKRNTGHGFVHYLNRMRVNRACDLLTETDKPVTDVCFETGFNNVSNFNRQFLKLCGLPPSEYRRQAKRNMCK
ncbi:MAG TPA: AraC family transcriptional regulator, partial [Dongiaceae bacterium]|nr:AraC family transcriptional regulator [Dongiaceae bacterium]